MGSDRQSNTVRCGHLPMSFTRESQGYALSQRRLGSTSSQLESRFHYVHSIPIVSLAIPRAVILATFCTITHIQYLTIRHLILAETTRSRLSCLHFFFCVFLSQDWNRECPPTFGKFKSTTPALPVYDRIVLSGSFANGRECGQWDSSRTF